MNRVSRSARSESVILSSSCSGCGTTGICRRSCATASAVPSGLFLSAPRAAAAPSPRRPPSSPPSSERSRAACQPGLRLRGLPAVAGACGGRGSVGEMGCAALEVGAADGEAGASPAGGEADGEGGASHHGMTPSHIIRCCSFCSCFGFLLTS